jgi:outer membrane protein insertion porin family
MTIGYLLLLTICVAQSDAGVQRKVGTLAVRGNLNVSTQKVLSWLSLRPGAPFSATTLTDDLAVIRSEYRSFGFLNCLPSADKMRWSDDSSRIDITLNILEGPQTLVGSVVLSGNSALGGATILEHFDLKPGMPFDREMLEADIGALLARYERLGYPFVQCRIDSLRIVEGEQNHLLDVGLSINEGPRLRIDEILVEGNTETMASVVVRETRLAEGELFDPAKISKIRDRLRRLNIFSEVAEPELFVRDTSGGLRIRVKEGTTNTFDGIVGYIPASDPGQSGFFTGLASVSMRNLFGTGRKLQFRWQREDRYSQELGVRYVEPWVFAQPVNLGGGFFQRQQDTTYVKREFSLRGELMLSEEFSVGALAGWEAVIPSASAGPGRVSRMNTTLVGVEVLYDTRNDNYSPTAGARYRTDYHYGRKKVRGAETPTSSSIQRFSIDLDFFVTTFRRQVIALGLHGRELQSTAVEESELYRFGGMHSLRGYRENQFLGTRIAWSNTEYRFLLSRKSFLYGFIDTGYYYRPPNAARSVQPADGFKTGYGIGLQVETGLGVMGVSFALGEGDSFSNAKIHFGLINEF